MRTWLAGIAVALFLAGFAGLMVQGKQLRDERADKVRLEEQVGDLRQGLRDAQAKATRLEAENATRPQRPA